jgi:ABC-type multidrug transport system ATPase subunit
LVVTGANGAGKSTLLKIIAGLLQASEGRAALYETDARTSLGMAALEMAVYPALTCREHLVLSAQLRGCSPRVDELLAKVGLSNASEKFGQELSTGMKMRLKFALAIQPEPKLLLLDEPGAALDESGRTLLEQICAEQAARGALIIATNDPAERRLASLELELAG